MSTVFQIILLIMEVNTYKYWAIIGISVEHKNSPCSYANCFCFMRTKLLVYGACYDIWIRILPTINNEFSLLEWCWSQPYVSHIKFFVSVRNLYCKSTTTHTRDVKIDNSFRGRISSEKFGMNYDNINVDPHINEYELKVQGTNNIPDLVNARHV